MTSVHQILQQSGFAKEDIIALLKAEGDDKKLLFKKSAEVKQQYVGDKVYFRGLIEFSNICAKDCLYCGIRKSNKNVNRYNLTDEEILEAARFAFDNRYGSIVLQSGELKSKAFTKRISRLLDKIMALSDHRLRVTLSCGEQDKETYREWLQHGAARYLLRIESSDRDLYYRLHPGDKTHSFEKRLEAIYALQEVGFQLGTGVMIGLPFQTYEHLASDLLWMQSLRVDMVGMGPYLEHQDTPLYRFRELLHPKSVRLDLALKMVAILRIMMKNINIAATTALQSIDPLGREKAIKIGANVIMPNITPGVYRNSYKLYENKPCTDENADDCTHCLDVRIAMTGHTIAWDEWGDSEHFTNRIKE